MDKCGGRKDFMPGPVLADRDTPLDFEEKDRDHLPTAITINA